MGREEVEEVKRGARGEEKVRKQRLDIAPLPSERWG